ncbi:1-acyl-sn-glycerol-3-phosphate acyltransferase [Balneatrix alpica]|nr:1-acyl-sn-glycerol-3-phosphate acyltransferase [Balneatrix alpica]
MMTSTLNDAFQDIRPFHDSEVKEVIARLIQDQEFIAAIARFKFPQAAAYCGWLLKPLVAWRLRQQAAQIATVRDFQQVVSFYMDRMIHKTTTALTFSGLDKLEPGRAYLFISNHRDIAMDPAFVNYGLWHNGFDTVRIAIGDNLLRKPYVTDLMRLNKSFIVKRSAKGVREMMAAYTELSSYIDHSIQDGHSIWIAQREGRAKDGRDDTDPAITKMLYMCRKKSGMSFAEAMQNLHIVPVSISYELNPCDRRMARELQAIAEHGRYEKAQYEDIQSIVEGIIGNKGRVHVAFGHELTGSYENPEALAAAIDAQIQGNYYLHGSNLTAAKLLGVEGVIEPDQQEQDRFQQRLQELEKNQQPYMLEMYAEPVRRQRALAQELAHD